MQYLGMYTTLHISISEVDKTKTVYEFVCGTYVQEENSGPWNLTLKKNLRNEYRVCVSFLSL
jgi:hypothetical protein